MGVLSRKREKGEKGDEIPSYSCDKETVVWEDAISAINQRTAPYSTCLSTVKYLVVPTAQGIISQPLFVTHNLINEHNDGRRHHLLG